MGAQSASATLTGTVVDEGEGALSDVEVTVTSLATGWRQTVVTDADGGFIVPSVSPGTYRVRLQREGFVPAEIPTLTLNVNDQRAIRVRLTIAGVGETVSVQAEPARVSAGASVGTVIDRQFVENLPLNGRSFQTLIALTPGVVAVRTSFAEQGQFSINGQRSNSNYFMVDGVSANVGLPLGGNLGQGGAGAMPGLTSAGSTQSLVSVDALEEFRIETSSYAAEFGRVPGGQISLVTRSGSNVLHGSAFEYVRNEAFDANDWFANREGLAKAPMRQHDAGGVLGGPLLRDRLFYFASYEGLRLRLPQTRIIMVPSDEARAQAVPGVRPILDAMPRANGPATPDGLARLAASYADQSRVDSTSARVDAVLPTGMRLFGRVQYSPSTTRTRSDSLSTIALSPARLTATTMGATHVLTKALLHDLRVNVTDARGGNASELDDFGGAVIPADSELFSNGATRADGQLLFRITGSPGLTVGRNLSHRTRQINVLDTVSLHLGAHQVKAGIDYRRLTPATYERYSNTIFFQGMYGATGAINGRAGSGTVTISEEVPLVLTNWSAFLQDHWRVSSRATLTYGVRWERNAPIEALDDYQLTTLINVDDRSNVDLGPLGTPLWRASNTNFGPRLGLSYQLSQRAGRELTLRGGGGLFYDLGYGTMAAAGGVFPYARTRSLTSPTFPLGPELSQPLPRTLAPPYSGFFYAAADDLDLPRTYQWNATLEQSIGRAHSVSVAFVGAEGRDLLFQEQYAQPNVRFAPSAYVVITRNASHSDYRALQTQYQRRLSRGWQATASYTLSRSRDTASSDNTASIPAAALNPERDYAFSDFDARHVFTGALSLNLPAPAKMRSVFGGWWLDGLLTARSGLPVNVRYARDIGFGTGLLRPDVVSGVPLTLDDPAAPGGRRFNREAFVIPTEARQGTLPRNAVRGFGVMQVDLSVRRRVQLTERIAAELRVEAFNVLNRPNFADPTASLSLATFGQATAMLNRGLSSSNAGLNPLYQIGGPRSMQLGARLTF